MDWFGDKKEPSGKDPVVDMNERQSRIRFAPLGQIEGYWNALRGGRVMPLRSEIDPRGLKGALEFCFVLERIAPGLARLRVAGSHLGDLMGMEVRGMPISSFLTADSRQRFGEALEEVFETPATATVTLNAETGFGRPALNARMILLPVRSDLGDTSRILGGFVTDGDLGRVPRRFNVTDIQLEKIVGRETPPPSTLKQLRPDDFRATEQRRDFAEAPVTSPAVAEEDAARFDQPIPGVPYLRVVK
ncbi:PAS domain-containing protein [Aliishimia ponticola]|uniref:PAS domain-containing protein n=1 Tax=Aliishimia ponticola TaxID=2499833 RepID=A0A4S4NFY4_9RHOB|nr:PAS domain-containing protein [Aliishimia ponticola]THH38532.1 PAS domain-containing protein [Aliishimia ponticola]